LPPRPVTDLAFDPSDANVAYATVSGFDATTPGQPGHIFKTTNALGATPTWSSIGPTADLPHNTIVVDPLEPSTLYVGTDAGVWTSSNAGGSWSQLGPSSGMPNVPVNEIEAGGPTIIAFTHGRGAFKLVPPLVTSVTASATPALYTGSCPATFTFTGTIMTSGAGTVTYRWHRSDGALGPIQMLSFAAAGSQMIGTTWMVGAAGVTYAGWEQLEIISPDAQLSNQATFDLLCPTPISGTKLSIKDADDTSKRKVVFKSADPAIVPAAFGTDGDPTCSAPEGGGLLRVFSTSSGQDLAIHLPCAHWTPIDAGNAQKGYRYKDKEQLDGPCKLAVVKAGKTGVVCSGKVVPLAYDLTAGGQTTVGVVFGNRTPYCAKFPGATGTLKRDDEKVFGAKNAPAPPSCPVAP
jgi:hypothetical protein